MVVLNVSETEMESLSGPWKHVRVYCEDPCATVEDVVQEIERRWPGEKFWRKKPQGYSRYEFEANAPEHYIYARFSVRV